MRGEFYIANFNTFLRANLNFYEPRKPIKMSNTILKPKKKKTFRHVYFIPLTKPRKTSKITSSLITNLNLTVLLPLVTDFSIINFTLEKIGVLYIFSVALKLENILGILESFLGWNPFLRYEYLPISNLFQN